VGGEKLSRKQEEAIAALLTTFTLQEAAQLSGVSVSTLKRWRKDPDFAERFAQARGEVVERALLALLDANAQAVETLRKCLTAKRAGDRIRAAHVILSHTRRGFELNDLAWQVAELRRDIKLWQGDRPKGIVG